MRNPLAWAFLIVGLIVGGVVGGVFAPLLGGGHDVVSPAPIPSGSVAPENLLPFHLSTCPTPDCIGTVPLVLGNPGIKPPPKLTPGSGGFTEPSNMSVNGAGNIQDVNGPIEAVRIGGRPAPAQSVGPTHAITIPEASGYPRPRMQTLYINRKGGSTPGAEKTYYLVTCYQSAGSICPMTTPTPTPSPAPHT